MEAKMRPPPDPTVRHGEDDVIARGAASPVTAEAGLNRYLEEIRRFPMLGRREEFMLAKCWREQGDREAVDRLVTSHLRLVTKIAMGYRAYGLPITEVSRKEISGSSRRSGISSLKKASACPPMRCGGSVLRSVEYSKYDDFVTVRVHLVHDDVGESAHRPLVGA
jgi:Sigma-70 factor, region 1.2